MLCGAETLVRSCRVQPLREVRWEGRISKATLPQVHVRSFDANLGRAPNEPKTYAVQPTQHLMPKTQDLSSSPSPRSRPARPAP